MKMNLRLRGDASEFLKALSELEGYVPNLSLEGRKAVLNLFNSPSEFISFESSTATKGTHLILLKPSKRLLDFLAALRAGDFNNRIIKRKGHKPPLGSVKRVAQKSAKSK